MLKNATRPRSKSLLEVGFGGLARSILEEMRTIREEMDVKTMEALEDAAANNDEFILGDEGYKVPELQDSGMMLQDGTLEGSTETGALREHLVCSSVLKKRRRKMRRHKHKKRLRKNRYKSRR